MLRRNGSYGAPEYIRFFGRVAEATDLPVAIQNAPAFFGRGLTSDEIRDLVTQHPNIRLIKGEGPVTDIAGLIERTEGRIPVFNGRGGLDTEGAPFIASHIIQVTEKAFDDFAASGTDLAANRRILGLS